MDIKNKVVVVTGGASGIGRALCAMFAQQGARGVVVADRQIEQAQIVAREVGGFAVEVDVSCEADIQRLVQTATEHFGQIDVFCSNAGIMIRKELDASSEEWRRIMDVNLMAHVYAARAVVPQMLERGEGYLINTASAAGLLTQVDSALYAVSKHAAVALAEWLSIAYGDKGIRVSCLCPQGVRTPMLLGETGMRQSFLTDGALTAEEVAQAVLQGMQTEQFLILPHAEVRDFMARKGSDYDRWIRGMRRLRTSALERNSQEAGKT